MIVDKKQLDAYLEVDADLIPLHVWNKQTKRKGKIQKRGKTPIDFNWATDRVKNIPRTLELARKGHNVGYRLGDTDLIIDIDPRNFKDGNDPVADLCSFMGVSDLADISPTVITGGGGYHHYFSLPEGHCLREMVDEFPGIEFKTKGRQVVAAGSKHPDGEFYNWDDLAPDLIDRPEVPQKLIDLLTRPVVINTTEAGELNGEELSRLLEQLPVEQFSEHEDWLKIMMASHHATAGLGIEEFIEWSCSDDFYADDEGLIRYRWDSLSENKNRTVTVKTLYKEVLAFGGDTNVSTAEDFEGLDSDELQTSSSEYKESSSTTSSEDFSDIYEEQELDDSYKEGVATELANTINSNSPNATVTTAIRAALQAGTLERVKALGLIQKNLGITKGQLNELIKAIKDKLVNDMGRTLANKTLELEFHKGKGLVYNSNDQFWIYTGTHWSSVTKKYVEGRILSVLDKMRLSIDIEVKESTLIGEALSILGALTASRNDLLRLSEKPYPVVNCKNGEVWLSRSGAAKLKPHRPGSYMLQTLDVEYSPGATCPIFDKAIRETFINFDDGEDIIRHFEEFMGYMIQPNKDIASWWLFKGPGGDGKSTLMAILSALLGNAVLPESIDRFKTGVGGDNHIMERMVGALVVYDDDLDKNAELPNGPLKKISENKVLSANPKGYKAFNFINCASPVMLSNGFPRTKDVSRGFRRRAQVIPFNRTFHEEGGERGLADRIIKEELAGVLNRALEGYKRLRERGDFLKPKSCLVEENNWLKDSNSIALFMSDCVHVSKDVKDQLHLKDLYQAYIEWCVINGIRYKETKNRFKDNLEDLGYPLMTLAGNYKGYRQMKLRPEIQELVDDDDFSDF